MESEQLLIKISGILFSLFSSGGSRRIFTFGDLLCDMKTLLLAGMGAVF